MCSFSCEVCGMICGDNCFCNSPFVETLFASPRLERLAAKEPSAVTDFVETGFETSHFEETPVEQLRK